jgi:serine/threonine-protein kinase
MSDLKRPAPGGQSEQTLPAGNGKPIKGQVLSEEPTKIIQRPAPAPPNANPQAAPPFDLTAEPSEDEDSELKNAKEMLGRHGYTDVKEVSSGGMGRVYCATEDLLGREVAIKVMRKELFNDAAARERFMEEARAAAKLQHPNIVVIHALKYDPGENQIFIVMERLKGYSMEEVTAAYNFRKEKGEAGDSGPMVWERARKLFLDVCEGLERAHNYENEVIDGDGAKVSVKRPIIHRDIKPGNLFIVRNNGSSGSEFVKILDFGLAKVENTARRHETVQGTWLGSPEYMSPEQFRGFNVDSRTDIYAIGASLHEMLTGEPPFRWDESLPPEAARRQVFFKLLNEMPTPPHLKFPGLRIAPAVSALIMKCLAKEPADRFQTVAELREAIDKASDSVEEAVPRAKKPAGPRLTKRKKIAAGLVLGTLIAAGITAGFYPSGKVEVRTDVQTGNGHGSARQPAQSAPARDPAPTPPTAESRPDEAASQQTAPVMRRITFRTNPRGVRVRRGGEEICITTARGCSVELPEGADPVTFTFNRPGFRETSQSVVPDADREVSVVLERINGGKAPQRLRIEPDLK